VVIYHYHGEVLFDKFVNVSSNPSKATENAVVFQFSDFLFHPFPPQVFYCIFNNDFTEDCKDVKEKTYSSKGKKDGKDSSFGGKGNIFFIANGSDGNYGHKEGIKGIGPFNQDISKGATQKKACKPEKSY